jgi:hypothetical protein
MYLQQKPVGCGHLHGGRGGKEKEGEVTTFASLNFGPRSLIKGDKLG